MKFKKPMLIVMNIDIWYGILIGYFVLAHDEVIEKISRWNIPLIISSVILAGVYIYLHFGDNYAEDPTYNSVPAILYAWSACLAILGSAYKWYNHRTRLSEFMTKHSYGLYFFYYLPLSVSAYFLTKYTSLPPILIYFIVLICGFAGGLILGEIMSRIPFMRWAVLGIKKEKRV